MDSPVCRLLNHTEKGDTLAGDGADGRRGSTPPLMGHMDTPRRALPLSRR